MGFPRQEYWDELPFPFLGYLPDSGIEPASPALAGRFFTTEPPGKPNVLISVSKRERKKKNRQEITDLSDAAFHFFVVCAFFQTYKYT